MTDQDKMPFGTHKGEKMANVPSSYLAWFYRENEDDFKAKERLNPKVEEVMKYIEQYGIDELEKESN